MPENQIYSFVFVRKDIPIANQLVQVGHACQHAGAHWGCPSNCYMALFECKNEEEILEVEKKLKYFKFNYTKFFEPDYPIGNNAICTEPVGGFLKDRLSEIFKKAKLWTPDQLG